MVAAVTLICFLGYERSSRAQTFDFGAQQLENKYNDQLKLDNGDVIKNCSKRKDEINCNFENTNFQKSVQAFKQLNLANGRFELNEKLILSLSGQKVRTITLVGSREDPMNLFHFVGQLGSLIIVLNPELTQDQVTSLLKDKLGIMRGYNDSTIGHPMVEITEKFAATCNNQRSSVSTKVGCVLEPRY